MQRAALSSSASRHNTEILISGWNQLDVDPASASQNVAK